MKKIIALFCGCLIAASSFADPNQKVLNAFKETFKTASNIKWQDHNEYYTVSFNTTGIYARINYDLEGNILGSTRHYEPNMLPLNILTRLKRENPKRELFGVTEVTVGDDMVFFVKIHDAKHWITLRVDAAGNSQVYEKYRKA